MESLVKLFINEIVRLHRVQKAIILDNDPRFTSKFCKDFQWTLGTKMKMSYAFYPKTNGKTERTISTMEGMLKAYNLEWQED